MTAPICRATRLSHCSLPATVGSSKSPFSPRPFVPREATAALFWEQVGGGKALFFFFPSPFILLQALIIEGLNLSCSCLLPSFPDSISNKGLWFGLWFFSFSFPLQRSKACNEKPTPSPSYSLHLKPSASPAPPSTKAPPSPPHASREGGHPIPAQGTAAGPPSQSWEVNKIELQGRAACKLPPL